MPAPLLTTKLYIPPPRPALVPRPRLVERLNAGLQGKLILVSAPAGFGKTTLLSEWVHNCGWRVAWLSLDKSDNDPPRFWSYVIMALQAIHDEVGESVLAELCSAEQIPVETIPTLLINDLSDLPISVNPFALILDDYHVIENPAIHEGMVLLLEHLPPPIRFVIASRADPPWPLARLRARGQVTELRAGDLRFTPEEVAAFLNEVMELELSAEDIAALDVRTEGWIVGLQMAALALQARLPQARSSTQGRKGVAAFIKSFGGSHHFVLDFLVEEVLDRQSSDIQAFLLQTSILERMTASLCDAVTGRNDSQALLTQLEQANLFLFSLDDERRWYRYHHLFSDLLKGRLKQTYPDSSVLLHQRASIWYAAEHDLENAIAHALAAQDFERAASLVEQVVQNLDTLNQQAMLTFWVDSLPREILETRPWLCVYRAWGDYWMGRRGMEEEWLQAAEKSIERAFEAGNPERQHIQGHIAAVRAYTAFLDENIPRVLEMGQRALDLLPDGDEMRCGTAVALGCAYWALGDVIQSEQVFGMARAAGLKVSYTRAVPAICYVGIQQVKQGRLQDGMATFRDGLRMATRPDGSETPVAGFPNVKLGDVWRERNDLALASQYLIRGVEQCVRLGQVDVLTDAYVCLGRYQLAIGDLEGTLETLHKADRVAQQTKVDPYVLCWLDDCRLKAWLAEGNLEAANLWAQNSGLSLDGPFSYQHDLHHQNLARVLVAQGILAGSSSSHEKASSLLARLRIAAEKAGWVHEEIKILVLQAVNDQAHGMGEAALQSLARALELAEPGGYVRVFVDEGTPMRLLILDFRLWIENQARVEARKLKGYADRLLSAFPQAGPTPKSTIRDLQSKILEPLSERELEVLRLLVSDLSSTEIADVLVISANTVRSHIKSIYGKLNVHHRDAALERAKELGLL